MRKFLITGLITASITVIAGVIFYACKKDSNEKVTKSMSVDYTPDFSLIPNIADIGKEDGMLVFQSLEHYGQTIDALVEICEQYSEWYVEQLENKLGCSIEDADEDVVAEYIVADNFFPYNPLMQFIDLIGFTNSLYPVLRTLEVEWMANEERFLAEANPFDEATTGYVQSALHDIEGFVIIKGYSDDEGNEGGGSGGDEGSGQNRKCRNGVKQKNPPTPPPPCGKSEKIRDDSKRFTYPSKNGKERKLSAILATTSTNVRAKTTIYYKNCFGHWILWCTRVDVSLIATKSNCDPYDYKTCFGSNGGFAVGGLVEKYHTFKISEKPTYIIRDGHPYIRGTHECIGYIVETQIAD